MQLALFSRVKTFRMEITRSAVSRGDTFSIDPETALLTLQNMCRNPSNHRLRIILILKGPKLPLSNALDLGQQLRKCQSVGIVIAGFSSQLDLASMVILAACNYRYAPPLSGPIEFGVQFRFLHFGEWIDQSGLDVSIIQHGEKKSQAYMFQNRLPPKVRHSNQAVAEQIYETAIKFVRECVGSKVASELAKNKFRIATAMHGVSIGLLTDITHLEFLGEKARKAFGQTGRVPKDYALPKSPPWFTTIFTKKLVYFEVNDLMLDRPSILAKELIKLSKRRRIAGLLLIINCHGGDLNAADRIWTILDYLRKKIPIVAYLRQSTSAGYYIATAANQICINPCSFTGSIGTMISRIDISKLAKQLGLDTTIISAGDGPVMNPIYSPPTSEELGILQNRSETAWTIFIERIMSRRRIKRAAIIKVADGQLITASSALRLQLVDEIGYFNNAVNMLRLKANVSESTPLVKMTKHSLRSSFMANTILRSGVSSVLEQAYSSLVNH
jgi:signal peptide peptidase SppA